MIETSEKFAYIDALRGIAILGVILIHIGVLTYQTGLLQEITFYGQRGVQLFYIVSAVTLCNSAEKSKVFSVSDFFIRRFFRIAPMFYFAVLLNVLLYFFAQSFCQLTHVSPLGFISGLLFLNSFFPSAINHVAIGGWSVAVESNFYIVFPIIFLFFRTFREVFLLLVTSAVIAFAIGLAIVPKFVAHTDLQLYFTFLWFPIQLPVFLMGMITYRAIKYFKLKNFSARKKGVLGTGLLVCSVVTIYKLLPSDDVKLYPSSFALCLLVLSCSLHQWSFLVNRITRFFGKISYSLYLLHFYGIILVVNIYSEAAKSPLEHFLLSVNSNILRLVVVYALVLALSVPACLLTWKFIETPGIALGKVIISGKSRKLRLSPIAHR